MKKSGFKKFFRGVVFSGVLIFALIGFFLTAGFFAVKYKLTDAAGSVDFNDKYFDKVAKKYNENIKTSDIRAEQVFRKSSIYYRISLIDSLYPKNGGYILSAFEKTGSLELAERMISAAELYLTENQLYASRMKEFISPSNKNSDKPTDKSIYYWMNSVEWESLKGALAKEKELVKDIAKKTGVEPRLIITMFVGEQMRIHFAEREQIKKAFLPLKLLHNSTKFSYGISGIKDETGALIEGYLKDSKSPFYPGEQYKKLLDYPEDEGNIELARYIRLTDRSHYWSYLYTALFVKEIITQWKNSGFDIEKRPEILATIFNIGFINSKPNSDPKTGGAEIKINEKPYTYGSIGFEFYFSGELLEEFPYELFPKEEIL